VKAPEKEKAPEKAKALERPPENGRYAAENGVKEKISAA
jgi:hypothetical protein